MKISVIIPFSHYPHYLKECLESLKTSAFQDVQRAVMLACSMRWENTSIF